MLRHFRYLGHRRHPSQSPSQRLAWLYVDSSVDSTSQLKYDNDFKKHIMSSTNLIPDHGSDLESARGSYEDTSERLGVDIPFARRTTLPPSYEQTDTTFTSTTLSSDLSTASRSTVEVTTPEVQQKHLPHPHPDHVTGDGGSSLEDV
jgi:hypothetical protein